MAVRRPYSGTGDAYVIDTETGVPLAGRDGGGNVVVSGKAYTAATGGSVVTDLTNLDGSPITGGVLVPDQYGRIPRFNGPNNDAPRLWLDFGSPAGRVQLLATDIPERVAALEDGGGSTGGISDPPATAVVYSGTFRNGAPATDTGNFRWRCDGSSDQTEINAAITAVRGQGGGMVQLLGDTFNTSGSILQKTGVGVKGEGYGTTINAATNFQAGMFVLENQDTHADYLGYMTLNGAGKQVHGIHYNNPTRAENLLSLYAGDPATRPDSMHVVEHLFILNPGDGTFAGHGMRIAGEGSRAGRYSNIRILSPSGCGFWADGSVDSHIDKVEIGGAGGNGPTPATSNTAPVGHGFYFGQGDSWMVTNSKSWYSRGAGVYVRGVRNTFSSVYCQDNYGPGWWLAFGKNSYASCHADSNGQGVGANGFSRAGWYITSNGNIIQAAQSYDRDNQAWVQQYGYQWTGNGTSNGMYDSMINGIAYGNSAGAQTGTVGGNIINIINTT